MPKKYDDENSTKVQQRRAEKPHLPHERDESSASQGAPVHDVIEQARDDIVSGKQDTDLRGTPGLDKPRGGRKPAGKQ